MNFYPVLFDDFWTPLTSGRAVAPAYEVEEGEAHYLLSMDMPGVPKDQIQIELLGDQLSISGSRVAKRPGAESETRRHSQFQRAFTLPPGVDGAKIEADYQDGVLHVFIPKVESAKRRTIQIGQSAGPSGLLGKWLGRKTVAGPAGQDDSAA